MSGSRHFLSMLLDCLQIFLNNQANCFRPVSVEAAVKMTIYKKQIPLFKIYMDDGYFHIALMYVSFNMPSFVVFLL